MNNLINIIITTLSLETKAGNFTLFEATDLGFLGFVNNHLSQNFPYLSQNFPFQSSGSLGAAYNIDPFLSVEIVITEFVNSDQSKARLLEQFYISPQKITDLNLKCEKEVVNSLHRKRDTNSVLDRDLISQRAPEQKSLEELAKLISSENSSVAFDTVRELYKKINILDEQVDKLDQLEKLFHKVKELSAYDLCHNGSQIFSLDDVHLVPISEDDKILQKAEKAYELYKAIKTLKEHRQLMGILGHSDYIANMLQVKILRTVFNQNNLSTYIGIGLGLAVIKNPYKPETHYYPAASLTSGITYQCTEDYKIHIEYSFSSCYFKKMLYRNSVTLKSLISL